MRPTLNTNFLSALAQLQEANQRNAELHDKLALIADNALAVAASEERLAQSLQAILHANETDLGHLLFKHATEALSARPAKP